jgi:hypothetical protein
MSIINATTPLDRLIANAERVLADYDDANKAWQADGANHSTNADLLDWYESSTEAFWAIANWVSNYGTPEQKAFVANEARDFDKVWTERYDILTTTRLGYWKDV